MAKLSSTGILLKYFSFIGNLCLGLRTYQPAPPDIQLRSYTQADAYLGVTPNPKFLSKPQFQNDFITKNGTDYVISEETRSIKWTCQADYPIRWDLPTNKEEITYGLSFTDSRKSDFTGNSLEPVNRQFKSVITMYLSRVKFFSADLSCRSILNPHENLESSVYIFMKGKDMIENEGRTLEVFLDPPKPLGTSQPPLILPCRPASPNIKLVLEKETLTATRIKNNQVVAQKSSWTVLTPQENDLTFDPKIGFTLQRGIYGDRIFGIYKCSVLVNPEVSGSMVPQKSGEFLLINVTMITASSTNMEKIPEKMSFESRSVIREKASVKVDYHPEIKFSQVKCCTGVPKKPPTLLIVGCISPFECDWAKESVLEEWLIKIENLVKSNSLGGHPLIRQSVTDCEQNWLVHSVSSVVVCKGENVDFVEQYVNLFHPLAGGLVHNRSERIRESGKKPVGLHNAISLTQNVKLSQAREVKSEEKMIILVTRPTRKARPGQRPVSFSSRALLLLDLVSGASQIVGEVKMWNKQPVLLREYPRDVFYEGETLIFACIGVRYFYTEDGHIRLNWQNGTKTVLDNQVGEENSPETKHNLYMADNADMFYSRGSDAVSVFGIPVNASIGMTSVDCWMPKRGETKWDKISKDIKILPNVAPKFAEQENETVYVYLGDTAKQISCTMISGLPMPWLIVYKNGKRVKLTVDGTKAQSHGKMKELAAGWHNLTGKSRKEDRIVNIHLDLPMVEHTHQLELKCVAKNVNGTATRTVNIFVIERPGKALPISLSILGVTVLILVALGMKRWYDKRKLIGLSVQ